jgi:phosphate transport system substrate-binding protein
VGRRTFCASIGVNVVATFHARRALVTREGDSPGRMIASRRSFVSWVALALVVAACGGQKRDAARVVVRGSDTMTVLLQRWAVAYPPGGVEVSGGGSGVGIAALTNGTIDIAAASRRMTPEERRLIEERRGPVVEESVALDAVAIYVHEASSVEVMSLDDARRVYLGEVSSWTSLGGSTRPIARYSRENTSGTYAFFKEEVLAGADFAPDVQCLPGTAAVVRAVARDPFSIGYGGIASARGVRAVAVRDAAGNVTRPTRDDAMSGRYPLARPLYLYFLTRPSQAVSQFIRWLSSSAARSLVERAGFFPTAGGPS